MIFLWIYTTLKLSRSSQSRVKVWYSYEFTLLSNDVRCRQRAYIVWYSYEFTLLSNQWSYRNMQNTVWYSYEFTLLSNKYNTESKQITVWYSYEFTLLSNMGIGFKIVKQFDIPMNLHYSQTHHAPGACAPWFDIPMNLHYSQTGRFLSDSALMFDIPMNLHYSQTTSPFCPVHLSLIFLWIYTTLKPICRSISNRQCLIFLWIYTTLKLHTRATATAKVWYSYEFTLLSNKKNGIRIFYAFDIPMNLHYSQTNMKFMRNIHLFDIPMNLHYSQTHRFMTYISMSLIFLWIYTTLKLWSLHKDDCHGLIFLWIYTTLKHYFYLPDTKRCLIFLWIYTTLKLVCHSDDVICVWYSYEFTLLSNFTDI